MKIACLVRGKPHHTFFVNEVHRHHAVSLVVVERPPPGDRLRRLFTRRGAAGLVRAVAGRYGGRAARAAALTACFGAAWRRLDPALEVLVADDVNAEAVRSALTSLAPDVLLDHGTSIVRPPVLATAPLALNLHWGLSPYYRGTSCTEWALLNWDPYNVGVTVHELSQRIDGGRVVAQQRVAVRPGDTVQALNHRLTRHGTQLLVAALDRLRQGRPLDFHAQAPGEGFLYQKRHFSEHLRRQVRHLERSGLLEAMLEHPARHARLPIVEPEAAALSA